MIENAEIINMIKYSNRLKARLCYEFDVSSQTVARWLENNPDGELTGVRVVKILADELSIPEDTILIEL